MNVSSSASPSAQGLIREPPLSPGAPVVRPPAPPAAQLPAPQSVQPPAQPVPPVAPLAQPPAQLAQPVGQSIQPAPVNEAANPPQSLPLEAQVVRLGLMTPDDVATTMREEAETGRTFAELAVEGGRISAEDLAKLTGTEATAKQAESPSEEQQTEEEVEEQEQVHAETPTEPETEAPVEPALRLAAANVPAPETAVTATPEPQQPVGPEEDDVAPEAEAAAEDASTPLRAPEPVGSDAPTGFDSSSHESDQTSESTAVAPHTDSAKQVAAEVFLVLSNGERIAAGSFGELQAAEQRARELMKVCDQGEWPSVGGRFVRPDAIVAVDVDVAGSS